MGRCPWAGWRGVAYTNVDTARRMRGSFSASDERFTLCGRVEVSSYFIVVTKTDLKDPPVPCPGPPRGPRCTGPRGPSEDVYP